MAYLTAAEAYKAGQEDFNEVLTELLAEAGSEGWTAPTREMFASRVTILWQARILKGELPPLTEG